MERDTGLCTRTDNDLSLFVGGELDLAAGRELARHLEACADCRVRERAARAAYDARMQVLTAVDGRGPDLWPGLRTELAREGLLRVAPAQPLAPAPLPLPRAAAWSVRSWTWAAAAAVLVLCSAWAVRGWLQSGSITESGEPAPLVKHVSPSNEDALAVQPVGENRLRPLRRGERALQDGAVILGHDENLLPLPLAGQAPRDIPVGEIQFHRPRR